MSRSIDDVVGELVDQSKDALRRKLLRLLDEFDIRGIQRIVAMGEFEKRIRAMSSAQAKKVLQILRE